jgi:hypothetical protein
MPGLHKENVSSMQVALLLDLSLYFSSILQVVINS